MIAIIQYLVLVVSIYQSSVLVTIKYCYPTCHLKHIVTVEYKLLKPDIV